jgi:hypothetical protein
VSSLRSRVIDRVRTSEPQIRSDRPTNQSSLSICDTVICRTQSRLRQRTTLSRLTTPMQGRSDGMARLTDTPPLRYAMVEDHPPLYRGSYPLSKNLRFLERLHLKTILSITPEPLGQDIATWCSAQGVRMMHLATSKEAKSSRHPVEYYKIKQALQVRRNLPS